MEKEYLAYDCTSISTYSQALAIARRGKNKEYDQLEQINLAFISNYGIHPVLSLVECTRLNGGSCACIDVYSSIDDKITVS